MLRFTKIIEICRKRKDCIIPNISFKIKSSDLEKIETQVKTLLKEATDKKKTDSPMPDFCDKPSTEEEEEECEELAEASKSGGTPSGPGQKTGAGPKPSAPSTFKAMCADYDNISEEQEEECEDAGFGPSSGAFGAFMN